MSTRSSTVRRLQAVNNVTIDALADVLIDCVEGGASVSFMHPLTRDRAAAFWRRRRKAGQAESGTATVEFATAITCPYQRLDASSAVASSGRTV